MHTCRHCTAPFAPLDPLALFCSNRCHIAYECEQVAESAALEQGVNAHVDTLADDYQAIIDGEL